MIDLLEWLFFAFLATGICAHLSVLFTNHLWARHIMKYPPDHSSDTQ